MSSMMDLNAQYCANNFHAPPVVLTRDDGACARDDTQTSEVLVEMNNVQLAS